MATINPTITFVGNDAVLFSWTLNNTDFDGAPVGPNHVDYDDRMVTARGTFGGATLALQGSNELPTPANWNGVDDPQGVDVSFAAAGSKPVAERPVWTRPLLTGGAASSVVVEMLCRRSARSLP